MQTKSSKKTRQMVQLAILTAIMIIFAFTPIGYLKFGIIEITLMCIPVAIGAIILGPLGGAVLGAVFGITSFIQCFGLSAFGALMLQINPVFCLITCLIPRILCGWLSGLLFHALSKVDKTKIVSYFAASLSTALLNTIFFTGSVLLFFWRNATFTGQMGAWGIGTDTLWLFLVGFIGLNGIVEAVVNFIVGGAIAKILKKTRFVD